ncbi:hypothetical protein [Thermoleptolyngbya sp.]
MIFIIPIILGAAALIAGGTGAVAGAKGVTKIREAQKIGKEAEARYEEAKQLTEEKALETQAIAEEYAQLQIQVYLETVQRFVDFIERIGQQVSQSDMKFLEGMEGFSPEQFQEYKTAALEAKRFAVGGLKAAGAAYAAGQGTITLVGLFGTASTGTAISGLSGAAAWNATLAWLGGGSLATGGGGMALGSVILGGITVGPALMIGGFVLRGQGEKALTKAQSYVSEANVAIAKLAALQAFLKQVQNRIQELSGLVVSINERALKSLNKLESKVFVRRGIFFKKTINFKPEEHAESFQEVLLLIKALVEILKTPVLDEKGEINQEVEKIRFRYRNI